LHRWMIIMHPTNITSLLSSFQPELQTNATPIAER
jgi:hypothetical protein